MSYDGAPLVRPGHGYPGRLGRSPATQAHVRAYEVVARDQQAQQRSGQRMPRSLPYPQYTTGREGPATYQSQYYRHRAIRMASSLPSATDTSRLADPTSHSCHWRPSLGENLAFFCYGFGQRQSGQDEYKHARTGAHAKRGIRVQLKSDPACLR